MNVYQAHVWHGPSWHGPTQTHVVRASGWVAAAGVLTVAVVLLGIVTMPAEPDLPGPEAVPVARVPEPQPAPPVPAPLP